MKKDTKKDIDKCKLNNLDFLKLDTKDKAYVFGLLNADGYITRSSGTLWIYTVSEDFKDFKDKLISCLPFTYHNRQLSGNRKPQTGAALYSSHLLDSLIGMGFDQKSLRFINYNIRKDLVPYYLRGYFDGDGCFFFKSYMDHRLSRPKLIANYQFNVSAGYNFDWSLLESILTELSISYRIVRYQYTNSGFSRLVISRKKELSKLIDFLYSDKVFMSLQRKKTKAEEILKYINKSNEKKVAT